MSRTGVVEQVSRKEGRTGLKIDGTWYSIFEEIAAEMGDRVAYDYTTVKKNGKTYNNLTNIEVVGHANSSNGQKQCKEEQIARSVALKCAVETSGPEAEVASILSKAEMFLDFIMPTEPAMES